MIAVLAAPAGAAPGPPASSLSGPEVAGHASPRDVVLGNPSRSAARISASAGTARYPIEDGTDATIAVSVTAACQASCTAADPQRIASFIGSLLHGPEVELLKIQIDAPFEIALDCGYGAQACYYAGQNKIVIAGNDTPAQDGASRDFVLAHEYGHHVAKHRQSPVPFLPAIDWGTPRWSSQEQVCQGTRARDLFPGTFGLRYFRDPGEAFAEAFAHYHFPHAEVPWRWLPSLKPDADAFEAIREDVLSPWERRDVVRIAGRLPRRGGEPVVKSIRTPLDGRVSLRATGPRRYRIRLLNRAGRVLRTSGRRLGPDRPLNFTVCGQSRLRIAIEPTRRRGPYRLQIRRP